MFGGIAACPWSVCVCPKHMERLLRMFPVHTAAAEMVHIQNAASLHGFPGVSGCLWPVTAFQSVAERFLWLFKYKTLLMGHIFNSRDRSLLMPGFSEGWLYLNELPFLLGSPHKVEKCTLTRVCKDAVAQSLFKICEPEY